MHVIDLLRNHVWNMQALITETDNVYTVLVQTIHGTDHSRDRSATYTSEKLARDYALTVLGMED